MWNSIDYIHFPLGRMSNFSSTSFLFRVHNVPFPFSLQTGGAFSAMILKCEVVSQLLDVTCFPEQSHPTRPLLLSTKSERVGSKPKD